MRISSISRLSSLSVESHGEPKAIIVKGNPKYLKDPEVSELAKKFYEEIKKLLEKKGFAVSFDPGEPFTSPDEAAAVWVGHSRGIDRLRFAPPHIQTIALETKEDMSKYQKNDQATNDRRGKDPQHYELSDNDKKKINSLKANKS